MKTDDRCTLSCRCNCLPVELPKKLHGVAYMNSSGCLECNLSHLAVTGENGLLLLIGSNYLRSYYLWRNYLWSCYFQSCTRVRTCLLPGLITRRYVKNRNSANFRDFYSRYGKSHKKVDSGWSHRYTVGPSSNRWTDWLTKQCLRFNRGHWLTFFAEISCRSVQLQRNASSLYPLQKHAPFRPHLASLWPRAPKF